MNITSQCNTQTALITSCRTSSTSDCPAVETELTFPSVTVESVPFSIRTGKVIFSYLPKNLSYLLVATCLPTPVHQYLYNCKKFCHSLPTYLPNYLLIFLLTYLLTYVFTYVLTYLLTYLLTYVLTYLRTFLFTC